mmetsp:Transcript_6831/g.9431  ORF Transcript_6831/g.9431 Transcript_6831/m.9431 type:complete len:115 (+) Transcript_6831:220-564(+)
MEAKIDYDEANSAWVRSEPASPRETENSINILGDRKSGESFYGSFRGGNFDDSRQNIAGFMKHEYRRRIRSPLDAGITAILFLSILGALVVGIIRPLLNKHSLLSEPLSQMFFS